MENAHAKLRYSRQKNSAKKRGIAWGFSFKTWVEWRGDDCINIGRGSSQLQMQRKADVGPYSPSNTIKGNPKQNGVTYSSALQNRKSHASYITRELALDAAMTSQSREQDDELTEDQQELAEIFHGSNKGIQW